MATWVTAPLHRTSGVREHPCVAPNMIRDQLKSSLSPTFSKASFMYQNSRQEYPNPGLKIKDVGIVGLPLSSDGADTLKRASHRAPFGKGTETVVDENVRKTWQINAADISFANTRWDEWVQKRVMLMAFDTLAILPTSREHLRAELYKLLLYEQDAHFKPHQDSEKVPNMFATLAICLPTEHEGGELILEHAGKRQVWNSANTSAVDLSFAAW